jgi:hypothetical protein
MTVPETPLLEALRCGSHDRKSKAGRKEMRAGAGFAGDQPEQNGMQKIC